LDIATNVHILNIKQQNKNTEKTSGAQGR